MHADADPSLLLALSLGIFALAHLFLLVMALDAVKARNTIQIVGLCLFNAMFLVYAIIQIDEIRQVFDGTDSDELAKDKIPVTLLTTLIPTMIGLCEIGYLILSWFCWREMGWDIYKVSRSALDGDSLSAVVLTPLTSSASSMQSMGADRRLKRLFFHYQVFLCICKFSFFFFLGFSIQVCSSPPSTAPSFASGPTDPVPFRCQLIYLVLDRDWEFWLTIIALPFSLLILLLGWMSARYEYRWVSVPPCSHRPGVCIADRAFLSFFFQGMGILQGTLVVLGAYYVLKLTRIWQSTETLLTIVKSLTVFAVLSLILVILTSAYTVVVWRGFGLGLKEGLDRKTQNDNLKKKGGLADGGQIGGRLVLLSPVQSSSRIIVLILPFFFDLAGILSDQRTRSACRSSSASLLHSVFISSRSAVSRSPSVCLHDPHEPPSNHCLRIRLSPIRYPSLVELPPPQLPLPILRCLLSPSSLMSQIDLYLSYPSGADQ